MAKKVVPETITYTCDRCKKEIKTKHVNEIKIHSYVIGTDLSYDLCDTCLVDLQDFMGDKI